MPTNVNTNFLAFHALVSRQAPDARVLPLIGIDFTKDTLYTIDLTATVQSAQLANPIQAAYIDCSGIPTGSTVLTVAGSGQRISVAPGVQGYYPLLIPSRAYVFSLQNLSCIGQPSGTCQASVFLVNVPMVAAEWSALGTVGGFSNVVGNVRRNTSASDVITTTDYTVLCDAGANQISEFLPTLNAQSYLQILNIVKVDATQNYVYVYTANNQQIALLANQNDSVTLQWNGSGWSILGHNVAGVYEGSVSSSNAQIVLQPSVKRTGSVTVSSGDYGASGQFAQVSLNAGGNNALTLNYTPTASAGTNMVALSSNTGSTILQQDNAGNVSFGNANGGFKIPYAPGPISFTRTLQGIANCKCSYVFQVGGPISNASGTVNSSGGTVWLICAATGYANTVGPLGVKVFLNGATNVGQWQMTVNETGSHKVLPINFINLGVLAAGSYPLSFAALTSNFVSDSGDYFSCLAIELPS